jgi:hypothetical protein
VPIPATIASDLMGMRLRFPSLRLEGSTLYIAALMARGQAAAITSESRLLTTSDVDTDQPHLRTHRRLTLDCARSFADGTPGVVLAADRGRSPA